jgi:hypothetical protein
MNETELNRLSGYIGRNKCNLNLFFPYICTMKNEITIPDHFPDLKEEDKRAADKRRENYSLSRDIQAREDNDAIVRRLARDKEKQS